jgi:Zn-dependent metalloprotease
MKRILVIIQLFLTTLTFGQKEFKFRDNSFKYFEPNDKVEIKVDDFFKEYGSNLGFNEDNSFKIEKEIKDKHGYLHQRFQQYFKNIKVKDAYVFIHSKDGYFTYGNGNLLQNLNIDINPKIKYSDAILSILDSIPFNPKTIEKTLKVISKINTDTTPFIINFSPNFNNENSIYLVYSVKVDYPLYKEFIIDANTKKVLSSHSSLMSCAPGIFTDDCYTDALSHLVRYDEKRLVTCFDDEDSQYHLHDCSRNITTINTNYSSNEDDYTFFKDNDNHWNESGVMENIYMDAYALDAHWSMSKAFDLFKDYGILGYDNNSSNAIMDIHFASLGDPTVFNAFWNQNTKRMMFGDGDGVTFSNFASLDVVGHEYTHGVMFNAVGLSSGMNDMSAIHEALADIFGILTSYETLYDNNWQIGNEIIGSSGLYSAIRDLENPNDNTTVNLGPDTYLGELWGTSGPHQRSLVLSHWFYLFVNGGTGTNDNGDAYSIIGAFDKKVAGQLVIDALLNQGLVSNATMLDFRTTMLQQAITEYGECSAEYNRMIQAFYAVGLGYGGSDIDISVSNLQLPNSSCELTSNNNLSFDINNMSCTTINVGTNIQINININDNITSFVLTIPLNLLSGQTYNMALSGFDFSLDGLYKIEVEAILTNDFSISNNLITGFVRNVKSISSPIQFGFENVDMLSLLPNEADYFWIENGINSSASVNNFNPYEGLSALKISPLSNSYINNYTQTWSLLSPWSTIPTESQSNVSSINFCLDLTDNNLNFRSKINQTHTSTSQTIGIFRDNSFYSPALNANTSELSEYRDEAKSLSNSWGNQFVFSLKNNARTSNAFTYIDNIEFYEPFSNDLELIVTNIPSNDISPGQYPINVNIFNLSPGTITSPTNIIVQINGVIYIIPLNQSFSFNTTYSLNDILSIIDVSYNFEIGQTYNITVAIDNTSDQNLVNNSVQFTISVASCAPYTGEITVGASGDFTTIQEAINKLVECKIGGDVTVLIDGSNGVFNEQILVPYFPSTDGNNYWVNFVGINNAEISSAASSDENFATIKVSKSKKITFSNLKVVNTGIDKGTCFHICDSTKDVKIKNCTINNQGQLDRHYGILIGSDQYTSESIATQSSFDEMCYRIKIDSCNIGVFNIGVFIANINSGISGMFGNPTIIYNSTINATKIGVYSEFSSNPIIVNCQITSRDNCIVIKDCTGSHIRNNILNNYSGEDVVKYKNTTGFVFIFFFPIIYVNEMYNNFIISRANEGATSGIFADTSDYLYIYNNSVSINGGINARAFKANSSNSDNIGIKNNSFACFGSSEDLAFEANYIYPSTIYNIDNNNLFVDNGTDVLKLNNTLYNNENFMNNPYGYFAQSISSDPLYNSPFTNLHISCNSPLIDRGEIPDVGSDLIAAGNNDIDHQHRNAMRVDIGADEYIHNGFKAYLEGAYTNHDMKTTLMNNGLIPNAQPYDLAPYNNDQVLSIGTGNDSIVDWVLVEARNIDNICGVEDKTAAILLKNGYIVSPNSMCNLEFPDLEDGMYYFVIRHRNHLDVMTSVPISYPFSSEYDFTLDTLQTCDKVIKELGDRTFAMYAGDVKKDGIINIADQELFSAAVAVNAYNIRDVNFDGNSTVVDANLLGSNIPSNLSSCSEILLDENGSTCNPCSEEFFNPNIIPFEVLSTHSLSNGFAADTTLILCGEDNIYISIFPNNGNYTILGYEYSNAFGVGFLDNINYYYSLPYVNISLSGSYTLHVKGKYDCVYTINLNVSQCEEDCEIENNGNVTISCTSFYVPVCGCNGITYQNSCIADVFVQNYTQGACPEYINEFVNNGEVFCYKRKLEDNKMQYYEYNLFWDKKYTKFDSKIETAIANNKCSILSTRVSRTSLAETCNYSFKSQIDNTNVQMSMAISKPKMNKYSTVINNACVPCFELYNSKSNLKNLSDEVLSLEENEIFKFYPNPAKSGSNLFIKLPNIPINNQYTIRMVDMLGVIHFTKTYISNGEELIEIETPIEAGSYLINLSTEFKTYNGSFICIH